jgi:hypothetical protein
MLDMIMKMFVSCLGHLANLLCLYDTAVSSLSCLEVVQSISLLCMFLSLIVFLICVMLQSVPVQAGKTPPLLQYFGTLLTRGKLYTKEMIEHL